MKSKVVVGCVGVVVLAVASVVFLGGENEILIEPADVAQIKPEKSVLVSTIDGIGEIKVAGPCYEGTRGNDVFPPENSIPSDCYSLMSDGQDYLDARSVSEDVYVRVSEGTDSVYLGEGDDIVEVRGSFDMVLDAGSGDNVLALPGLDVPDVSLRVSGEDIILEGKRGTILMRRQYPRSGESAPIKQMIFRNRTLYASDIYTKAIDGQATDGDDVLTGTPGNDVIYPGRGNDKISALEGDDAIFYEGGNDIIMGSLEGVGEDTLSFPFNRSEVQVTSVGDRDMKIITPRGSVTLQFQVFFPVGNDRSNIEKFIFKDGIYLDAEMRSSIDK